VKNFNGFWYVESDATKVGMGVMWIVANIKLQKAFIVKHGFKNLWAGGWYEQLGCPISDEFTFNNTGN